MEIIRVTRLTIDYWAPLEQLFATSSGVSGCWCMWPLREPGTHQPDTESNKKAIRAMLDSGESPGLIAMAGKDAHGWCAVGPRERYPQYERTTRESVAWAIPCLYIEPTADRPVVARGLIEAAVDLASSSGAAVVVGPPPWWLPGDEAAIAEATSAFVANGFDKVGPGVRMPELRRALRANV